MITGRSRCLREIGAPAGSAPIRQCDFHHEGGPPDVKCPYYCDREACRRRAVNDVDGGSYCDACAVLVLLELDGFVTELTGEEWIALDRAVGAVCPDPAVRALRKIAQAVDAQQVTRPVETDDSLLDWKDHNGGDMETRCAKCWSIVTWDAGEPCPKCGEMEVVP